MESTRRSTLIWIASGVVAGSLIIALVWRISAYQTENALEARYRARQHAEIAETRIERVCGATEGRALLGCIAEQIAATREDQRAEYDLSAQNRMAEWTYWMMWVSALTTGLTAVALLFVKGTLDATREAVSKTAEGTSAALRAAVIASDQLEAQRSCERAHIHFAPENDGGMRLSIGDQFVLKFDLWNFGRTPARLHNVYVRRHKGRRFEDPRPDGRVDLGAAVLAAGKSVEGIWEDFIEAGGEGFYVSFRADFTDAFETSRKALAQFHVDPVEGRVRSVRLLAAKTEQEAGKSDA